MGATYGEACELAKDLRAKFPFSIEVDEEFDFRGQYYLSLIANFGDEKDLIPYLPAGWTFIPWENADQRAWIARVIKVQ